MADDTSTAAAFREFLIDLLPKSQQSKVDRIVEEFQSYADAEFHTVEVHGARVAVESVDAYGLSIELDANGNAVTVTSDTMHGFFIPEN
jgi:uncharacterized protein with PIN domain